jgi:hypothetical protein
VIARFFVHRHPLPRVHQFTLHSVEYSAFLLRDISPVILLYPESSHTFQIEFYQPPAVKMCASIICIFRCSLFCTFGFNGRSVNEASRHPTLSVLCQYKRFTFKAIFKDFQVREKDVIRYRGHSIMNPATTGNSSLRFTSLCSKKMRVHEMLFSIAGRRDPPASCVSVFSRSGYSMACALRILLPRCLHRLDLQISVQPAKYLDSLIAGK